MKSPVNSPSRTSFDGNCRFYEFLAVKKRTFYAQALSYWKIQGLYSMSERKRKGANRMVKKYLLDTNILLNYPTAIYGFEDNEVIITSTTIEELDNLKQGKTEKAFQARETFREVLTPLRKKAQRDHVNLQDGIKINRGRGLFRVEPNHISEKNLPQGWSLEKPDNRILSACNGLGAILVTEDQSLLFKAMSMGLPAQEYKNAQITFDDDYTGRSEITLSAEEMKQVQENGFVRADGRKTKQLSENEYLIVHDRDNPQHTILARYGGGAFHRLYTLSRSCKVKPRNAAQQFAIYALMAPPSEIPLVILSGEAGTAKTFLSITCGMDQLIEHYEQIIATRNNVEFDKDIGALPGDEQEKVSPLLRGVTDNLRTYLRIQGSNPLSKQKRNLSELAEINQVIDDYIVSGRISIESMGFMRGRSITDSYLILDECQNATPLQVMGIVTRAAEGCKIVMCGDPNQIDKITLTRQTNGLVFAARAMQHSPACAYVAFEDSECERSFLAKEAAERMGAYLSQ